MKVPRTNPGECGATMSQQVALILNDTSNAYHWGCFGTSTEIRLSLEDAGYQVTRFGVTDVHGLKTPPRTGNHIHDAGFRRVFLADNPALATALKAADVVVVNGEGTLHGLSQAAMNLLYVSHLAKTECQKRVHLINSSLFPQLGHGNDAEIGKFYSELLAPLDSIVVREPLSYRQATQIGLEVELGFDCLPRYLDRPLNRDGVGQRAEIGGAGEPQIVLGGGLGLDPNFFGSVIDDIRALSPSASLVYVTGAPGNAAQDDDNTLAVLGASELNFEHRVVESFTEWCRLLASATYLISGRFHHTIAATFLGTPAVTFQAGTPKINGISEAFGFPAPIDCSNVNARQLARERCEQCLDGKAPALGEARRTDLLALAAKNFAGL